MNDDLGSRLLDLFLTMLLLPIALIVRGGLWQEVCLVSSDMSLPWADVVLSRIKMIEAHESIVVGFGNKQKATPDPKLERFARVVRSLLLRGA